MSQQTGSLYRRRILRQRDGRADDLARIVDLALQAPLDEISGVALPYQLSSGALDQPQNLSIWTNSSGRPVAFALHQIPFATLYYAVHPGIDRMTIEGEIFQWGQRRACEIAAATGGTYSYAIWPAARLGATHTCLQAQGYTALDTGKVFFARRLTGLIEAPSLPPGFALRPLQGEQEVKAATTLLQTAFGITTVTETWRQRILQQPQYRAELDLVVVAPDGQLAAFCLFWLHPAGGVGQIEPMATHPSFQRRGLGRAAIAEGLRRLQGLGADRVLVGTSSANARSQALYRSAGFDLHHRCVGFQYTAQP